MPRDRRRRELRGAPPPREALVHELAWMRTAVGRRFDVAEVARSLAGTARTAAERLLDDESFLAVCDTMEIDAMLDLT